MKIIPKLMAAILAAFSFSSAANAEDNAAPGNDAEITQIGEDQTAKISQRNIEGGILSGVILQNGFGNMAAITMQGGNLSGSITQNGSNNDAALEIFDENNRGAIDQTGDDNIARLRIEGYGHDVKLEQNGSGHSYDTPIVVGGDAPPGTITIRQY